MKFPDQWIEIETFILSEVIQTQEDMDGKFPKYMDTCF